MSKSESTPTRTETSDRRDGIVVPHRPPREADAAMTVGTLAGAAVGGFAGPPGVVVGSILGALAGIVAGATLQEDDERRAEDEATLDDAIGVTSGDLGAADPSAPPARRGCYSATSAGGGSSGGAPSEGPMQSPDEG